MSNGSICSAMTGFFAGLGVGAAAVLLYAPASGQETRQRIREKANTGTQSVRDRANTLKQQAAGVLDEGAHVVDRAKQEVNDAVNAGKQAFAEARVPKIAAANT